MVIFLDNYMLAPFFLLFMNCEVSQTNDVKKCQKRSRKKAYVTYRDPFMKTIDKLLQHLHGAVIDKSLKENVKINALNQQMYNKYLYKLSY